MIHLVRVGAMGHVGRFGAADRLRHARGARVIVRTARGLELGEVLSHEGADARGETDGELLRRATDADELLAERLRRNRDEAFRACQSLLAERGSSAVLVDVEHLFDGRGLYFYFLGPTDPADDALTARLAEAYDAEARFGDFSEALDQGCGPGCGTEDAQGGCGSSGGCSGCSVAQACSTAR